MILALYAKANALRPGTVAMSINGHYHTSRQQIHEGVFYLDLPATINGWWRGEKFYPYAPEHTFDFTDYDQEGNLLETVKMPLSQLRMGCQTLFYEDPLYAIVTLTDRGEITIKGSRTRWMYGIAPEGAGDSLLTVADYPL